MPRQRCPLSRGYTRWPHHSVQRRAGRGGTSRSSGTLRWRSHGLPTTRSCSTEREWSATSQGLYWTIGQTSSRAWGGTSPSWKGTPKASTPGYATTRPSRLSRARASRLNGGRIWITPRRRYSLQTSRSRTSSPITPESPSHSTTAPTPMTRSTYYATTS